MRLKLISYIACAGLTLSASAQTVADAGLDPHELVVAGFTATSVQLIVDRLDDQDVQDAWSTVETSRTSLASAQTACLEAQSALMRAPGDDNLLSANETAHSNLESIQASLFTTVAAFEALLFDQIPAQTVTDYNAVRNRCHKNIEPELLALDWDTEQMSKLISALQEEKRATRRGEDISIEASTLLLSARSQPTVVTARSSLQTNLAGVKSVIGSAD